MEVDEVTRALLPRVARDPGIAHGALACAMPVARQDPRARKGYRPRSSCSGLGIRPSANCFISLRIWPNCLVSWLTDWTVVPDP
jgi:hypothetical protein